MTTHLCALVEQTGLVLPAKIHVEYDLIRYEKEHQRISGQCKHGDHTADGTPQIYISPDLNDSIVIAGVILHELLHAALPAKLNHGEPFSAYAKKLGLRGPAECTTVGATLEKHVRFLMRTIGGAYPPPPPPPAPLVIPASSDYPRMLFHRTKPPVVVQSKAEEAALGEEWNRVVWPDDGSTPAAIDWAKSWLSVAGFPKSYYHHDTDEERIVHDPQEESVLQRSLLWSPYRSPRFSK